MFQPWKAMARKHMKASAPTSIFVGMSLLVTTVVAGYMTSPSARAWSYICTPVSTANLVGHWKFDEGSGTKAKDSTSFNNTGSLMGGALWTGFDAPLSYANQYAVNLNGTGARVSVSDTTGLPAGSAVRTIALWMNQNAVTQQATLVSLGTGADANQKFIVQMGTEAGKTYLFTDGVNAGNNVTLTGSQIPSAGWHHVAFSFDGGSNWKYYLDGVLTKSGSFPVSINTVTNALEIGSRHDNTTGFFKGRLDDVRVYGRSLSASEVSSLSKGCGNASSSSTSSVTSSSSSSTSSSSSSTSSSSSSSTGPVPTCNGLAATIYVNGKYIVGGAMNGQRYKGLLRGTSGNDVIVGTNGKDVIGGKAGNDTICAKGGKDVIYGDDGNDMIIAENGKNTVFGGRGDDTITVGNGKNIILGGSGKNRCTVGKGKSTVLNCQL